MKSYMKNISQSVSLLYFIFIISILNTLWFLYYNHRCLLVFASSCLVMYLINKNMIFVLGVSLLIVDSLYLLNLVKKEGFEDHDEVHVEHEQDEYKMDISSNNEKKTKTDKTDKTDKIDNTDKNSLSNIFQVESNENYESDEDEESKYMQDKSIIKKLKQFDPIVLNTLQNMNSVHIKEINKTINRLTNSTDP